MAASYYDIVGSIRYRIPELLQLQNSGKLREMMSLLQGCGYSAKETGLIYDTIVAFTQVLTVTKAPGH